MRAFRIGFAVASTMLVPAAAPGVDEPEVPDVAVVAVLPFEMQERNRIYVDLAPEGNRPFVLLLDTGAQHSMLTPGAARKVGVSVRRNKSSPYRRATRLGRDLQFYVSDQSSDTGSKTGWEIGILGGNLLEQFVVELDFVNARVRFLDPKKYRVPERTDAAGEAVVPVRISARRPFARLGMNGADVELLLDTGAPAPVLLSGPAAGKLGIEPDMLSDFGTIGTLVGPVSVKIFQGGAVRFAGFDLGVIPVLVAPRGSYNLGGANDSVVGFDILSQFTIRIDYPRQRMWLRRERTTPTFLGYPIESGHGSGATVYAPPVTSSYRVVSVESGSAAARLRLKAGDEIVQPQNGAHWTMRETLEQIANRTPLLVHREMDASGAVDVKLPDASTYDAQSARAAKESARDVAEEERTRVETWEREKNERIYAITPSGYHLVDDWQKPRGPKEGEEWVTYEELRRRLDAEKEAP